MKQKKGYLLLEASIAIVIISISLGYMLALWGQLSLIHIQLMKQTDKVITKEQLELIRVEYYSQNRTVLFEDVK